MNDTKAIIPYSLNKHGGLAICSAKVPRATGFCSLPSEKPTDKWPLPYLGVEIELTFTPKRGNDLPPGGIPASQVYAEIANSSPGFFVLKSDGSIVGAGIEINSAPATLAYHKAGSWNEFFALVKDKSALFTLSAWSQSSCGMHIHINKKFFTILGLSKLISFFGNPVNKPEIQGIAGRKENSYNKYKDRSFATTLNKPSSDPLEHYDCLNISTNTTVEFRVFRSSISRAGVYAALEFVDAISHYCNEASAKSFGKAKGEESFIGYLNWLSSNEDKNKYNERRRKYPYHMYLVSKVLPIHSKLIPDVSRPDDWDHEGVS